MKSIICISAIALLTSCAHPKDTDRLSVGRGEITIAIDESFEPIAEAQMAAYNAHYPDAKFHPIYVPEQKAVNYMLSDSADLIMISRELTLEEQQYYVQREREYHPARMALDAVALITNKESSLTSIDIAEIEAILKGKKSDIKLIFDNSSSSNLNLMLSKFDIKEINKANIFATNGTLEVFEQVEKNKNAIGLIGLNWISDEDDKGSMKLKDQIKVLGITSPNSSEPIFPTVSTIKDQEYPFVKIIYLHTTQNGWGVAMGFVRFACTQIGQLVVEKMGLQPYYLIPKNYQLTSGKPFTVVE
ncbi:PstS family phosphate ABC transporter substrate-binding protein [Arcticibacterium luteifluviistationis]|uniref:PBP domain-containing protein n=1 Tax=Arcticibacterium luteifluviistationis TaxID=1784714 RepID=A0A2Z4GGS4_9BACT|nr:substrate-binding domain-containing protein [Arcticibacterium luteifluviistationis]AWW00590.1 hypothetical protein DJ013_21340 [Arcticibacterium luteifluviistationis]